MNKKSVEAGMTASLDGMIRVLHPIPKEINMKIVGAGNVQFDDREVYAVFVDYGSRHDLYGVVTNTDAGVRIGLIHASTALKLDVKRPVLTSAVVQFAIWQNTVTATAVLMALEAERFGE